MDSKEPQPVAAGEVFKKRFPNLPSSIEPYLEDILLCMEDYHSLASSEISTLQKTIEEQKKEIGMLKDEKDLFAISYSIWYSYAPDAQIYKAQKLPASQMLALYKDRPYLRTDAPEEN